MLKISRGTKSGLCRLRRREEKKQARQKDLPRWPSSVSLPTPTPLPPLQRVLLISLLGVYKRGPNFTFKVCINKKRERKEEILASKKSVGATHTQTSLGISSAVPTSESTDLAGAGGGKEEGRKTFGVVAV